MEPQNIIGEIVTARDFEEKVVKDKSFEHCLIEIYNKHCGGCYYATIVLQAFSNKLKNRGLNGEFKVFQVAS